MACGGGRGSPAPARRRRAVNALTGFDGEPVVLAESNDAVATNGAVHDDLVALLART